MKRISIFHVCWYILIAAMIFSPAIGIAAEIRVVDGRGLTRAVSRLEPPVTVVVTLKESNAPEDVVTLGNIDGLSGDISSVKEAPQKYIFQVSQGGTWQIKGVLSPADIVEVRISK